MRNRLLINKRKRIEMSQITSGIRSVLSHPLLYNLFQTLMGAHKARTKLAQDFVTFKEGMTILDIGCGTGEILSYLPENISYYGFDISEEYIDHAKKKYGNRGKFFCQYLQSEDLKELPKFDAVIGIGILHHLSDEDAKKFMELSFKALKPGGHVLTRDPCYVDGQNFLAKFLVSKDRGQHVRREKEYLSLAQSFFKKKTPYVTHQKWIPYTHFTLVCRK